MPRYYFDTDDGTNKVRDDEDDTFPDFESAREMALSCLPDMVGDKLTNDGDRRDFTVDVRDERGKVVYTACLSLHGRRFV